MKTSTLLLKHNSTSVPSIARGRRGRPLIIHLYSLHGLFTPGSPHLGCDRDNGGQIVYVLDLVRELSMHPDVGHVTLVTRRIDDPRFGKAYAAPYERLGPKCSIRRISFGGSSYLPKELLWPHLEEAAQAILSDARRTREVPDLIHGHYADAGWVAARVSEALRVPMVQTGHSLGRVKLDRLIADGEDPEKAMREYAFEQRFAAEELTLAKAGFIVTSSKQEIGTYDDYAGFSKARFEIIPPGVDRERFKPETSPSEQTATAAIEARLASFLRDPAKPLITVLCRADRKKNVDAVLRAFGEAPELRTMANLGLVVGQWPDLSKKLPGERAVYEGILRQLDQFDLYGHVAYPKEHDPIREVPALYRFAARSRGMFVNVALTEPFGLTLLEAAASGLPVVATSDGGPSEIVPALDNGMLVSPKDIAAIQDAMRVLLTRRDLWDRYAANGIRNLPHRYSWQPHVKRYVKLVRDLVYAPENTR